jgi:glycerol-3-phosphate acyltransferase PlsY
MVWLWCIPAGYLLGSVSPSYILGKLIKGIDIREHGTRNAGTVNTYGLLGLWPAVLVAAYDLLKGLLAMYVCALAGGPPLCIYLAGLAAIAGHVFPFYLRFRGGQGVATATAIMIYYLIIFYAKSWLPLSSLVLLAFCVVSFSHIGRKGEIVGSVVLPLLAVFLLVFSPRSPYFYFLLSVIVYILFINVLNLQRHRLVPLSSLKAGDIIGWRLYLRPLAFSLVIFYLQTDKKQALTAIGGIALLFSQNKKNLQGKGTKKILVDHDFPFCSVPDHPAIRERHRCPGSIVSHVRRLLQQIFWPALRTEAHLRENLGGKPGPSQCLPHLRLPAASFCLGALPCLSIGSVRFERFRSLAVGDRRQFQRVAAQRLDHVRLYSLQLMNVTGTVLWEDGPRLFD